ncbi:hypothetical protein CIHG_04558 [Coccidioides immitis H538.4]|uniref:Uncharacterized protein n=3 Tax=Coccidioides immitis TaxID=5501 RepID=A0A0J8R2J9_COCIT|nr:hypothetical protein CIRG_06725 [Coccidioides immitis RMSCC 2394]KMU78986.1 hypothetical protein CISG_07629 [Coccidioides immitis RMSCC 3703]KMU86769.1 hypothetical protein CIHG_04558 [Coccidioides immitis H538.4]
MPTPKRQNFPACHVSKPPSIPVGTAILLRHFQYRTPMGCVTLPENVEIQSPRCDLSALIRVPTARLRRQGCGSPFPAAKSHPWPKRMGLVMSDQGNISGTSHLHRSQSQFLGSVAQLAASDTMAQVMTMMWQLEPNALPSTME